jgi:hypothetical protein
MKQRQENESWGWLYALFILCSIFMVGRIGYGIGYKAKSKRPPFPLNQGVFTEQTGLPASPIHNDVYITNHGTWAIYDNTDNRWKEAIVLPTQEIFEP